jgi:hypothetical protein
MSGASLPVAVGDVVHVQEPDYKYGQGALTLRVTAVGRIEQLDDGAWVHLDGTELRDDGTARAPSHGTWWCVPEPFTVVAVPRTHDEQPNRAQPMSS